MQTQGSRSHRSQASAAASQVRKVPSGVRYSIFVSFAFIPPNIALHMPSAIRLHVLVITRVA